MRDDDAIDWPELAAASPEAWAIYASGGEWRSAHHLRILIDYLMAVYRGDIKRLAVSFPPGHSKSETITKYFSTWYLGRRPKSRVVLTSYGQELSIQWGRATRDIFAEYGPAVFGHTTFTRAAAKEWRVFDAECKKATGGFLFSTSVGGVLTGKRAELLIGDDIVKDAATANNKSLRESIWDWWQSVAMSRLLPDSRVIVVGTRWHHDDVIGRIEQGAGEDGAEPWTILNFPAIAVGPDPTGRKVGEALWPEMFPAEFLETQRLAVGSYVWQALYQGSPTAMDGSMFRRSWFRYATRDGSDIVLPDNLGRVPLGSLPLFAAVDLSVSTKTTGDWTVISIFALDFGRRHLHLIDVIRFRAEGPDIVPKIAEAHKKYNLRSIYVEKIGFQSSLLQEALRAGLPVRPVYPDADKVTRAMPAAAVLEGGRLFLPAGAHWLPAWEHEILQFPSGAHDDQVDSLAYGVRKALDLWSQMQEKKRGGNLPDRLL